MNTKRSFSVTAALLALACGAGLLLAGVSAWAVLATMVLWLGSLWLAAPEPELAAPRVDAEEVSRDAMREAIEPLGLPLLLLEGNRIVTANAAARAALGDHIVDQDARIALRHPDAMRLLDMGDNDSVTISGFTGARSLWQLTRRRIDAGAIRN